MWTQRDLEYLGCSGCYFISLLHDLGIGLVTEVIDYYHKAINLGIIDKDCYIKNPEALATMVNGHKYSVTKTTERPTMASNRDILISEYYNPRTGKSHFCSVTTGLYDPLGDSVTVKEGYIRSYRYFKFIK